MTNRLLRPFVGARRARRCLSFFFFFLSVAIPYATIHVNFLLKMLQMKLTFFRRGGTHLSINVLTDEERFLRMFDESQL